MYSLQCTVISPPGRICLCSGQIFPIKEFTLKSEPAPEISTQSVHCSLLCTALNSSLHFSKHRCTVLCLTLLHCHCSGNAENFSTGSYDHYNSTHYKHTAYYISPHHPTSRFRRRFPRLRRSSGRQSGHTVHTVHTVHSIQYSVDSTQYTVLSTHSAGSTD